MAQHLTNSQRCCKPRNIYQRKFERYRIRWLCLYHVALPEQTSVHVVWCGIVWNPPFYDAVTRPMVSTDCMLMKAGIHKTIVNRTQLCYRALRLSGKRQLLGQSSCLLSKYFWQRFPNYIVHNYIVLTLHTISVRQVFLPKQFPAVL